MLNEFSLTTKESNSAPVHIMDLNYNLNTQVTNASGYNMMQSPQNNPGTSMWIGTYPSVQQLQQLPGQMANLNLDSGTNYLDSCMALSQQNGLTSPFGSPTLNADSFYVTSVQPSVPTASTVNVNNVPDTQLPNFANQPLDLQMAHVQMMTTEQQIVLLTELQRKNIAAGLLSPPPYPGNQQIFPQYTPRSPSEGSGSAPRTPTTQRHDMSISGKTTSPESPGSNLHQRSYTISDASSTTSSTSMPGSPISGTLSFNEDVADSPRFNRSPSMPETRNKPSLTPIRSASLKFDVKYPQDKCHKCMKKVYKMESVGPVKGVMYHNTCFTCKKCQTKLTLKNYCLNQSDKYDVSVYCKSHQPTITDKGGHIDTESVQIKGAMAVPKLNKINEQIKSSSKYHIDAHALDISHARNVPATNLQTANKFKATTWRKKNRKLEILPPPDVVRYSDAVPEYDQEQYERAIVEQQPDYYGAL